MNDDFLGGFLIGDRDRIGRAKVSAPAVMGTGCRGMRPRSRWPCLLTDLRWLSPLVIRSRATSHCIGN